MPSSRPEVTAGSEPHATWGRVLSRQPFWISAALFLLCMVLALVSEPFATHENFFNVTRNFAFIGLIALGQTAVIITAGIDLSVGSVMGLSGVVTALSLEAGAPLWLGMGIGLGTALACGAVNGGLIAYARLSPFVVTLGTLAIARSLALAVSSNRMVYHFGPDEALFVGLGGGELFGLANPVWILLGLVAACGALFRYTRWGRWLYAIGGNEQAALLAGVPVARVKLGAYLLCSATAGLAAVLTVGWLGAVTNALGQTYELRVIASAVIGGANLMGGEGGAYGALVGAALIEVIRNGLLLLGVDPFWQGTFVGLFIILAVALQRLRGRRADA